MSILIVRLHRKIQRQKKMDNIKVCKQDILFIGYKAFEKGGFLHILTVLETVGSDRIILRAILVCFGNYQVIDIVEYDGDDALDNDAEIITNLPWEMYKEIETSVKE